MGQRKNTLKMAANDVMMFDTAKKQTKLQEMENF